MKVSEGGRCQRCRVSTEGPKNGMSMLPAFAYKVGPLGGGNDVASGDYTLEDAALKCLELCALGFTHQGVAL
eukprot:COSAG03_NODE_16472_length_401_cov_0.503311_1_plen_72_part_00